MTLTRRTRVWAAMKRRARHFKTWNSLQYQLFVRQMAAQNPPASHRWRPWHQIQRPTASQMRRAKGLIP